MPTYECRPDGGTNSAGDNFQDTDTFDDWPWALKKVDILVRNNALIVESKPDTEGSYGDGQILETGQHSITFGDNPLEGVRVKNETAGNTAKYQVTGFPL